MRGSLPPRGRAAALMLSLGAAVLIAGGASYGWASAGYLAPIVLVIAAGLWLAAGRDSDAGAITRRQVDERQAWQRLQVQALVGRVLAVAVAIAYIVAVAGKATLWPFGVLLGVWAVAFVTGWWYYGEHGPRGGTQPGEAPRRRSVLRR